MEFSEGKAKFIETWGKLGSNWGVTRSMAEIHALLLISPEPLSTEDVMTSLQVSRGTANMNIRALMDWGLVIKELKAGDRREYFVAEKEVWVIFRNVVLQRKKKELEPMIDVLDELSRIEKSDSHSEELVKMVIDIKQFSKKADRTLSAVAESKASQFFTNLLSSKK